MRNLVDFFTNNWFSKLSIVCVGGSCLLLGSVAIWQSFKFSPVPITLDNKKAEQVQIKEETKLGGKESNKYILVADILENKSWWEWTYEKYLFYGRDKLTLHKKFEDVKLGYSTTNIHALNKVCAEAYSLEKSNFQKEQEIYKKNVELFCTKDGYSQVALPNDIDLFSV